MIVFSNTTPIIALSGIAELHLLPSLFKEIHVVPEVVEECGIGGKIFVPPLTNFPWIRVVKNTGKFSKKLIFSLDKGERATLETALSKKANLVIIDEKIGRNIAEYLGLSVTGTLGILLKARQEGLIHSFLECVLAMRKNGIFFHSKLVEKLAIYIGEKS